MPENAILGELDDDIEVPCIVHWGLVCCASLSNVNSVVDGGCMLAIS